MNRHTPVPAPILRVRFILALASAGLLLALGCAEIGAPPGGEVDRQAPRLLASHPADGATEVPADNRIEILFSERITKPEKGGVVFVSPRPTGEVKIDWKSDRVIIDIGETFQAEHTYVVTISSELTDLRNNRLDSAITVAFSTGAQLDSGTTSGRVLNREGTPFGGWLVGLYRHLAPTDLLVIDSIYPDYLTTTGRNGRFHFQNLPDDYYLLVGFEDKNRDELFDATGEAYALTDRQVDLNGDLNLSALLLTYGTYDTIPAKLSTARLQPDNLVALRFDRPLDATRLGTEPGRIRLLPRGSEMTGTPACGLAEIKLDQVQTVTASFGELAEGTYRIECVAVEGAPALSLDSVMITPAEDEKPPKLVQFLPGEGRYFAGQVELSLSFSEPLDTSSLSAQSIILWEDSLKTVPLDRQWSDCFRLSLLPATLTPGHNYRLELAEFDFVDLTGNRLGDSSQTHVFSTHDADSLGSISGRILVNIPGRDNAPARLDFQQVGSSARQSITVEPFANASSEGASLTSRPFSLTVPPGKYLVNGFLDGNGDGRLSAGTVNPYRLGETRMIGIDTIRVRARFETADVEITFD